MAFFFTLSQPNQIRRFLNISYWFQTRLLSFKAASHKVKIVFSEDHFVSLPPWIQGSEIDIPIEIFDDKFYKTYSNYLSLMDCI